MHRVVEGCEGPGIIEAADLRNMSRILESETFQTYQGGGAKISEYVLSMLGFTG